MAGTRVAGPGFRHALKIFFSVEIKTYNERELPPLARRRSLQIFGNPSKPMLEQQRRNFPSPPVSLPPASFRRAACQLGPAPVAFASTRDSCLFALLNEMTKQQICMYAETGVVTGLTPLDPRYEDGRIKK